MMWQMLKHAWVSFTTPFRPRSPPLDRTGELLKPREKEILLERNAHITQVTESLRRELALMARERRRE